MREEIRIWPVELNRVATAYLRAELVIDGTKVEHELREDLGQTGYVEVEITIRHYPEGKR